MLGLGILILYECCVTVEISVKENNGGWVLTEGWLGAKTEAIRENK